MEYILAHGTFASLYDNMYAATCTQRPGQARVQSPDWVATAPRERNQKNDLIYKYLPSLPNTAGSSFP